jgi:hypothetical protein
VVSIILSVVAIGISVVSARAAISSARASDETKSEAYRFRVDSASPRLRISQLVIESDLETAPLVRNPGKVGPGTRLNMTLQGANSLSVIARCVVDNEGSSTAYLTARTSEDVELVDIYLVQELISTFESPPKILYPVSLDDQNGWRLLEPGGSAHIVFRWTQAANEWLAEAGNADALPSREIEIECRDSHELMLDTCNLRISRQPIIHHPTEDAWIVAGLDMRTQISDGQVLATSSVGIVSRSYPELERHSTRNSWASKLKVTG